MTSEFHQISVYRALLKKRISQNNHTRFCISVRNSGIAKAPRIWTKIRKQYIFRFFPCQEPEYDERLSWEGRSDKMIQVNPSQPVSTHFIRFQPIACWSIWLTYFNQWCVSVWMIIQIRILDPEIFCTNPDPRKTNPI